MKKTALLVSFLITLAVLWTVIRQKQLMRAPSYITPAPIHPSTFPRPLTDKTILYIGEPTFTFPVRVPYVTISSRPTFNEESSRLFALGGITGIPKTIAGSRGRTTFASANGREGIVSETPLTFSFTVASYSGTPVSGNTAFYQGAAMSALSEWSLLPKPYKATLSFVRYFVFSGADGHPIEQSGPSGTRIAQVDMGVSIEEYPVFIGDADTPVFSFGFDGSGALVKLRGFILPDVTKNPKDVAVVSYQEAIQRLKSGSGILSSVSLVPGSTERFSSGDVPPSTTIEKVALGYLYSRHQDFLVPVFVFTGNAATSNDQRVITTTLVSAL